MFKTDAKLFLDAFHYVNEAELIINECKSTIKQYDTESSHYEKCKNNIIDCDINSLVKIIEDTKESLMRIDQDFANDYMLALQEIFQNQAIDTSNMSEEELMQYNINMNLYTKDYQYNIYYMLKELDESGALTPELEKEFEELYGTNYAYQSEIIAQYEISDQLVTTDYPSEEYINLYKKKGEHDRNIILLNPNLTEEEKNIKLEEFDKYFNESITNLQNEYDKYTKTKELEKEYEELERLKEENNGFFHPITENELKEACLDKKIEIGEFNPKSPYAATPGEIEYKNMNGFERACADTNTFVVSTFSGAYGVIENMEDAVVMFGGAIGVCDQDWAAGYVSIDRTSAIYDSFVNDTGMNTYSAYSEYHDSGNVLGEYIVKTGATFLSPGLSAAIYGLDAMGDKSESSLNNGDDFSTAFFKGAVKGLAGAVEGYGYAKLNLGVRDFLGTGAIKQLGANGIAKLKTIPSMLGQTGAIKNVAIAGWNKVKGAALPSLVETILEPDAMIETGCIFADNVIGLIAGEDVDWGKTFTETGLVFLTNYGMNLLTNVAFGNVVKKSINYPTMDCDLYYTVNGNTIENNIVEVINRHDLRYGQGDCLNRLNDFLNPNSPNFHNYQLITSSNSAREILNMYSPEQILHALDNMGYISNSGNLSSFFSKNGSSIMSNYGVDPGGIAALCNYEYKGNIYTYKQAMDVYNESLKNGLIPPHFKKTGTIEYFELKDKLVAQGFSNKDASVILSTIDDAGACSYAATANEIFASFIGREDEFFQKFGYSMYKQLPNGQLVLNSNELLLDMYVNCNRIENGGNLIMYDNSLNPQSLSANRFDVYGRQMLDAEKQVYMSGLYTGKNEFSISKFLDNKGIEYSSEHLVFNYGGVIDNNYFNNMINKTYGELYSGKFLTLDIYSSGNTINMISTNPNLYPSVSTSNWGEGGGHSIFITGIGTDRFYVSSWGKEYSIPFNDLKNGGVFNIFSATIN